MGVRCTFLDDEPIDQPELLIALGSRCFYYTVTKYLEFNYRYSIEFEEIRSWKRERSNRYGVYEK